MSDDPDPLTVIGKTLEAIISRLDVLTNMYVETVHLTREIHAACTAKPEGPSPLMEAMGSIVRLLNRITAAQAEHSQAMAVALNDLMNRISDAEARHGAALEYLRARLG